MDRSKATPLSKRDEEWVVEDFTRRIAWTDETAECATCESTFELGTAHYYATLRPRQSTSPTEESREVVFCSRPCVDEWRRS